MVDIASRDNAIDASNIVPTDDMSPIRMRIVSLRNSFDDNPLRLTAAYADPRLDNIVFPNDDIVRRGTPMFRGLAVSVLRAAIIGKA
jgi:hypothetical protein